MSTINGDSSLSSSLCRLYFSPRRSHRRVPKFGMGFKVTKKIRFGVKKIGGPRLIFWVFFRKNEKCLELPEMARKLINKFSIFLSPIPHLCRTISASVDGGLSGGSSVHRPGSEGPNQH